MKHYLNINILIEKEEAEKLIPTLTKLEYFGNVEFVDEKVVERERENSNKSGARYKINIKE
jgi:hypothetical protein